MRGIVDVWWSEDWELMGYGGTESGRTIDSRKWFYAVIMLFLASTVIHGIMSDFPKALRIYPDELLYVNIARSLFSGRGITVHNVDSNFQKILYSICIMPALFFESTAFQVRAIGYINGLIVSSSIFPVYALCRKMSIKSMEFGMVLAFWATLPILIVNMHFMSEVVYLPLSLWLVYCVWCTYCEGKFSQKLCLSFLLGILCYMAYIGKEAALYFIVAYIVAGAGYICTHRERWKKEMLCMAVFLLAFALCFWAMKMTLFYGMGNSYSGSNLSNIKNLELACHPEKVRYLFYALAWNILFGTLAVGIFPVMFPIPLFDKDKKETWFFVFLFISLIVGCVATAYTITLPEDFPEMSPRLHMRYIEPLAVPFFILMVRGINCMQDFGQTVKGRACFKVVTLEAIVFSAAFIVLARGGGSCLADNTMLIYYEYFARFICKSDLLLLAVRILMSVMLVTGAWLLCVNCKTFMRLFASLFIAINLINSVAGYAACIYRYSISGELRRQASEVNDYLWNVRGNILLVTDGGWESEDSRIFDTYVSRDFYVAEISMLESDGVLDDFVIDLGAEQIRCNYPYAYYQGLSGVDYLIVKDEYGISFQEGLVTEMTAFPLDGYSIYQNRERGVVRFRAE